MEWNVKECVIIKFLRASNDITFLNNFICILWAFLEYCSNIYESPRLNVGDITDLQKIIQWKRFFFLNKSSVTELAYEHIKCYNC